MYRLFFLMIAAIFGYMIWRIVRVVIRSGGPSAGKDGSSMRTPQGPQKPAQPFKDVKDAEFEDLKPPGSDGPSGQSGPLS